MDSESLDRCIQTALSALYPPFQATSPTVLCQVLSVVESCYRGDGLRYLIHFLLPAKQLLTDLQQNACLQYCGLLFRHEGWPLCVHEKVVVQLCPLDQRLLRPGDFYLLVSPPAAAPPPPRAHSASCRRAVTSSPRLLLCSVSAGSRHVEQQEMSEIALRSLFSMAWLDSVNREREQRGAPRLERCLLSARGDVFRVPWEDLVYPQLISRPQTSPKEEKESSVKDGDMLINPNPGSSRQEVELLQSAASGDSEDSEGEYVELTELPRFSPQRGSLTQSISLQHRARTGTHTAAHTPHNTHTHSESTHTPHNTHTHSESTHTHTHTLLLHTHLILLHTHLTTLTHTPPGPVWRSAPTPQFAPDIEENLIQDSCGPVILTPISSTSSSAPPGVVGTSRQTSQEQIGGTDSSISLKLNTEPESSTEQSKEQEEDERGKEGQTKEMREERELMKRQEGKHEMVVSDDEGEEKEEQTLEDAECRKDEGLLNESEETEEELDEEGDEELEEEGADELEEEGAEEVEEEGAEEVEGEGAEEVEVEIEEEVLVTVMQQSQKRREEEQVMTEDDTEGGEEEETHSQDSYSENITQNTHSKDSCSENNTLQTLCEDSYSENNTEHTHSEDSYSESNRQNTHSEDSSLENKTQHKHSEDSNSEKSLQTLSKDSYSENKTLQANSGDSYFENVRHQTLSEDSYSENVRHQTLHEVSYSENNTPAINPDLLEPEESEKRQEKQEEKKEEEEEEEVSVEEVGGGRTAELQTEGLSRPPVQSHVPLSTGPSPSEPQPQLDQSAAPTVPVRLTQSSQSSQSSFYTVLLRSGALCLPGTRDRSGRALLTVCTRSSVWSNPDCDSAELLRLLLYYSSTLRKEVAALGLTVLVDARRAAPVPALFSALRSLQENVPGSVHSVLLLVNKDSSLRLDRPAATQVEVFSLKSLQKHVDLQQLPVEFGGSFSFSQSSWLCFRSRVEQLTNQCEDVIKLLQKTINILQNTPLPAAAQEAELLLSRYQAVMCSILEDSRLVQLQQEGGASLSRLRREDGGVDVPADRRSAVETVSTLYEQVDELLHRLVTMSNSRTQELNFILDFRSLETGFREVSSWLQDVGEVRLQSLNEAEDSLELLTKKQEDFKEFHTNAYERCRRGEELLSRLDRWGHMTSADLQVYEVKVHSFWAQLQDFSQRVNTTGQNMERAVGLYSFLDQAYGWALEGMRQLAAVSMEDCTLPDKCQAVIGCLEDYRRQHPPITDERFQEMKAAAGGLRGERGLRQWSFAWSKCQETKKMFDRKMEAALRTRDSAHRQRSDSTHSRSSASSRRSLTGLWGLHGTSSSSSLCPHEEDNNTSSPPRNSSSLLSPSSSCSLLLSPSSSSSSPPCSPPPPPAPLLLLLPPSPPTTPRSSSVCSTAPP
ncbi:LOW QUALITY PROTEIN: rho guanine nucleotide exchange factor 40 [Anoplopoma fimbria]|uniref:LOW QUALITY PROTEIN: rho guanine nucleotide exchange factor 40 n=1 Tax=Anoplopoma fimbria TaxID=229290 RepID=UPI0023ECB418|nr:LOW QUALITY PROTEIN: rho guanine nucleotide exchange factor 40 [Anoplopoma fimbria]